MKKEARAAAYDGGLRVEAYRFEGIAQPFPNHFHEYYVIGLVEDGERTLTCGGGEYTVKRGDVLLFNPGDSHACVQSGGALDYRGLNIARDVMLDLAEEAAGIRELPGFSRCAVSDGEAARLLRSFHQLVMEGSREPGKREKLLLLLSLLIRKYGRPPQAPLPERRDEVEEVCAFMEQRCAERIRLDELCRRAGLSKSTLLRAFVRAKGVTPYRYLENIRVGRARRLLEQGVPPAEAALRTGFSDQSHFTNCFGRFIGLAPGKYRDIFTDRDMEETPHEE